VNEFLPRYNRADLLSIPKSHHRGPQANEDWVMEIRRQNYAAMERTFGVIKEAYADFERILSRSYGNPFFEEYQTTMPMCVDGNGDALDPGESRHPANAQQGKKSRFRAYALVPAVCG